MGATDFRGTAIEPGSLVCFETDGRMVEQRVVSVEGDEIAVQPLERHDLSIEEYVPLIRVVAVGFHRNQPQELLAAGWRLTPYGWHHAQKAPDPVEFEQAMELEQQPAEHTTE